ncbi:hypothetical protein ES708_29157 [subsurface metagenome]
MKKSIILIDGQNLFYTLKNLGLKEIDINWTGFFNHLKEDEDEVYRTYWFRPEKISFHKLNLYISRAYIERYKLDISPEELLIKAKDFYDKCLEDFRKQDRKYDLIKLDYENIAIIKKGILKVNPWRQLYIGEKGVDVTLVVFMNHN